MDVMNCRSICLSDCFDLARNAHGVDDEQPRGDRTGLGSFDYSNKTFAYPGTIIGAIKPLTS
jgi:hypothetical protein